MSAAHARPLLFRQVQQNCPSLGAIHQLSINVVRFVASCICFHARSVVIAQLTPGLTSGHQSTRRKHKTLTMSLERTNARV